METIFEVYSAEVQNVLFYSTLAMQPEETKKRCQKHKEAWIILDSNPVQNF